MDNIRWRIVGVMFLPSIFENRCGDFRRSMWRLSKIDVSPFEDRRSMSRCVDLRRSMIDGRWSMCRPSKIDGRCEIRLLYLLKTLILYISCMQITRGFALQCFHYIRIAHANFNDSIFRTLGQVCRKKQKFPTLARGWGWGLTLIGA